MLILAAVRYGGGAIAMLALATVFWFFIHVLGVVFFCIACAFAAVAAGYLLLEWAIYRSFCRLCKDAQAPYAIVNEYGHLELFGGSEEDARAYAVFSSDAFAKLYREEDVKPTKAETEQAKKEQKRLIAEEKALCAKLSRYRQFDTFTPADLPYLKGKKIFVSERVYAAKASESDWAAARDENTVEIIHSPKLGGK